MCKRSAPIVLASMLFGAAALAADGLTPPSSDVVWPRWQARVSVGSAVLLPVSLNGDAGARGALPSGAIFSDYYFDAPGLRLPASTGGLRATSGLMVGPRGTPVVGASTLRAGGRLGFAPALGTLQSVGDGSADTVPYLGVGYTGFALKGGWGITADLGLVAESPANAGHVGRALFGNSGQTFDGALRDMRFSPVLQVGVSYAF